MNSDDQILVLKDGKRLGPFSLDALLEQVERGAVNYEDACLRVGASQVERVRDILDWDDDPPGPEYPNSEPSPPPGGDELEPNHPDDPVFTSEEDGDEEEEEDEDFVDEFDLEEEIAETLEELEEESGGPPSNPSVILYAGHPSFLSFPRTVFVILISIGAGLWFRETSGWILLGGLIVALFGVSWIFLERSMRLYLVTPRRVEIVTGLFAKSSNEVRIEDIRTINVVKSGFIGLIGVGSVEFASAGGGSVEVSFQKVWAANQIKSLVRRLQDAQDG